MNHRYAIAKRVFDFVAATCSLLALCPLLIVIGLLVRRDGGPALFTQERVGQGGRLFVIYKFRSMACKEDKKGLQITADKDPRITKIGHFLRKTKIDELPQLINVALGHMSFVGPRPEVPYYVARWSPLDQQIILKVRPGVTDFASLLFSREQEILAAANDPEKAYFEIVMPEKLELYKKYVDQMGFWLDLRVILSTVCKVGVGNFIIWLPELRNELKDWEKRFVA